MSSKDKTPPKLLVKVTGGPDVHSFRVEDKESGLSIPAVAIDVHLHANGRPEVKVELSEIAMNIEAQAELNRVGAEKLLENLAEQLGYRLTPEDADLTLEEIGEDENTTLNIRMPGAVPKGQTHNPGPSFLTKATTRVERYPPLAPGSGQGMQYSPWDRIYIECLEDMGGMHVKEKMEVVQLYYIHRQERLKAGRYIIAVGMGVADAKRILEIAGVQWGSVTPISGTNYILFRNVSSSGPWRGVPDGLMVFDVYEQI